MPVATCAVCGRLRATDQIHRDGYKLGPIVPICFPCASNTPTERVWQAISTFERVNNHHIRGQLERLELPGVYDTSRRTAPVWAIGIATALVSGWVWGAANSHITLEHLVVALSRNEKAQQVISALHRVSASATAVLSAATELTGLIKEDDDGCAG